MMRALTWPLTGGLALAVAAPLAAQQAPRADTVADYIRIYGGEAAARSYAAAQTLAPYERDVVLPQGKVRALLLEARPRSTATRDFCFANALPAPAQIDGKSTPGMLDVAVLGVPTPQGAAQLGYRVFARVDAASLKRARPYIAGDMCVLLPAPLAQAGLTLTPLPPRDPRYFHADAAAARLAPRQMAGIIPPSFEGTSPHFTEMMVRAAKPGAIVAIGGKATKLKTPVTVSSSEAGAAGIELRRGKAVAKLDRCPSQWSPPHNAFVFDCPL